MQNIQARQIRLARQLRHATQVRPALQERQVWQARHTSKDAGSFRIKTKCENLKNKSSKTNPQNESLRFGLANPDLQVRKSVFLRIRFVL
jgi:hypothetical protein